MRFLQNATTRSIASSRTDRGKGIDRELPRQARQEELLERSRSQRRRAAIAPRLRGGQHCRTGVIATVLDPDGRPVDLTEERRRHIVRQPPSRAGHPELATHLDVVRRAIKVPDHRRTGRRPGEEWFYLEAPVHAASSRS
jgi:hypothetical protein